MALLCVGSVRGSPGATTLGVLLGGAWPRSVVLVEADPDGGVLAARCVLPREPGLAGLAAAVRGSRPAELAVWEHAQQLVGGLGAVVAHESSQVTSATLAAVGGRLGSWCASLGGVDVIADCGRLRAGSPALPLAAAADVLLVVVRPRTDELYAAVAQLGAMARSGAPRHEIGGLVLLGERPYTADQVREGLGVPVVGVVADDPQAARVLWEGGSVRRLRLSMLARSTRTLVAEIVAELGVTASGPDEESAGASRSELGLRAGGRAVPVAGSENNDGEGDR